MSNRTDLIKGAGGGSKDAAGQAVAAVFRPLFRVVPTPERGREIFRPLPCHREDRILSISRQVAV